MAVSVTTFAMHDVYHLRELLGYVAETEPSAPAAPGAFVHAHGGGAEHHHDAATDAMLAAAQRTDEPADEHHAPTLELASHLPVQVTTLALVLPREVRPAHVLADAAVLTPSPPPLPPPRA